MRNVIAPTLLLAAMGQMAYAQAPRPALPWNIGFEAPDFDASFSGTGSLLNQQSWTAATQYFVRNSGALTGTQAVEAAGGLLPSGNNFQAWRKWPRVTGGTLVMEVDVRANDQAGRGVFCFEIWGASSTATVDQENFRVASLGITDTGAVGLRGGSLASAEMANQTATAGSYNRYMMVYDDTNRVIRGFLNNNPLTNALNVPLAVNIPATTTHVSIGELDFQTYLGTALASRLAYAIPSTEARGNDTWFIDNLRVSHFPTPRSIRVKVTLSDFVGTGRPLANIPVSVTLTPTGGGTPTTSTATMNALGEFVVNTPSAGTYDIRFKPAGWCSNTLTAVNVPEAGVFNLSGATQNGDVDGSGEVDAADIDAVIANFGGSGDNIVQDADGTGEVDAADIDVVIANFGGSDA